jgi:hypothetical protein
MPSNSGHLHGFLWCEDSEKKGGGSASLKFRGNVPREFGPQTSLAQLYSPCDKYHRSRNLRKVFQHALYCLQKPSVKAAPISHPRCSIAGCAQSPLHSATIQAYIPGFILLACHYLVSSPCNYRQQVIPSRKHHGLDHFLADSYSSN